MIHAVAAVVALAAVSLPIGGTAHRKTEEGNRHYEEKAYDDALRAYTEAQVAAPEAPELHYDLGNVLYRQENWSGATDAYRRALLSAPPSLLPSASYNLGNALFKSGNLDDAVKAYRRALEVLPDDADAKRNLELALRAIAEKKEQQQPQQQQQQRDRKQERKEEPKQEQKQEQQGGSQDGQSSEQQGGDDKRREERKRGQGEEQPGQHRMSAEEAKSLLDSVNDQEKANLKKLAAARVKQQERRPEEDW